MENGTVDNQEEIAEFLTENGINVLLTANTRSTIVKALSFKCSNLLNKKAVLDSFWEGAEKLGLRTLLKRYPGKVHSQIVYYYLRMNKLKGSEKTCKLIYSKCV